MKPIQLSAPTFVFFALTCATTFAAPPVWVTKHPSLRICVAQVAKITKWSSVPNAMANTPRILVDPKRAERYAANEWGGSSNEDLKNYLLDPLLSPDHRAGARFLVNVRTRYMRRHGAGYHAVAALEIGEVRRNMMRALERLRLLVPEEAADVAIQIADSLPRGLATRWSGFEPGFVHEIVLSVAASPRKNDISHLVYLIAHEGALLTRFSEQNCLENLRILLNATPREGGQRKIAGADLTAVFLRFLELNEKRPKAEALGLAEQFVRMVGPYLTMTDQDAVLENLRNDVKNYGDRDEGRFGPYRY